MIEFFSWRHFSGRTIQTDRKIQYCKPFGLKLKDNKSVIIFSYLNMLIYKPLKMLFSRISLLIFPVLASVSCSRTVETFDYASNFYKIELIDSVPFINYFSVDALGKSKLDHNPVQWKTPAYSGEYELHKISDSKVKICRLCCICLIWELSSYVQTFLRPLLIMMPAGTREMSL